MILPIDRWSRISEKALSFALSMSNDIRCLHVQTAEKPDEICRDWEKDVAGPLRAAGKCVPKLEVLQSPYRYILQPVVDYVLEAEKSCEGRKVCVLVPESGGTALVGKPAAQSTRRSAQGNPAAEGQRPHYRNQRSLVSRTQMNRLRLSKGKMQRVTGFSEPQDSLLCPNPSQY